MNTIHIISIFLCGFAFGLILFIVLEKIFLPEVDYLEDDLYMEKEPKKNSVKRYNQNLIVSPKQLFMDKKLGLSFSGPDKENDSSFDSLKTKVFDLKNRNKIAL